MLVQEFLESFLPEYDEKVKNFENLTWNEKVYPLGFVDISFSEALKNYTEIVCKKQKQLCLDNATIKVDPHSIMNALNVYDIWTV